jgi:hypothetical protein
VADKGDSGSHSSHSDKSNQSNRSGNGANGRWAKQTADESGRDSAGNGKGNGNAAQKPQKKNSVPSSSVESNPALIAGRQDLTAAVPIPDVPGADRSGHDTTAGSAQAAEPPTPAVAPRVRFGNGRPAVPLTEPPRPPAPQHAAVPPTVPESLPTPLAPPPDRSDRFALPHIHLPGLPQLGAAEADQALNAFLGLAGLVLLPAAGAVLGYRQARSQGAETLGRP